MSAELDMAARLSATDATGLSLVKYDREVATGAPPRLAAFYAVIEMRHSTLGHAGDAQSCNDCYGMTPAAVEKEPPA